MDSDLFFRFAEIIRSLLPVFAAIGTVSSIVGFWKIFNKWGKPGYLSLLPFARGWIFGKDSPETARTIYAFSDGFIVVLTPIFYYLRANSASEPLFEFHGYTIYGDKPMMIITVIWAIAEIVKFLSSVHISANLCKKNNKGKRWIATWIVFPKIAKIIWGFSDKFLQKEAVPEEENPQEIFFKGLLITAFF